MSNAAMVVGYFVGFMDLVTWAPWLGDSQIKSFCIVAMVVFWITLGITCVAVKEVPFVDQEEQEEQ
jgi:solute carrier family 45 protein 1/2/4